MTDTLDRLMVCQICFENYTDSDEHVPRLLPCTHTLCEACIKKMLREESLTCPECRVKHPANNGVRTFTQNKYILTSMRRKSFRKSLKLATNIPKCEAHEEELVLFCTNSECLKPICLSCLTSEHVGHKVVDVKEGEKELLYSKVESLRRSIQRKKYQIANAKAEVEKNNESCVTKLKDAKEELIKKINERYEELIRNISDQKEEHDDDVDVEVASLDENLVLLDSITENTGSATLTLDDITIRLETFTDIEAQVNILLARERSFKFVDYEEIVLGAEDIEQLCGKLAEKEIQLEQTEPKDIALGDLISFEAMRALDSPRTPQRNAEQNSAQFTCRVTDSINTSKGTIYGLCVVDATRVVVYRGGNELTQYTVPGGGESHSIQLQDQPNGIARVRLGNKCCMALSYKNKKKIEFRDANNLYKVIHSYSVAPHQPWTLCASTTSSFPSVLMYEDTSKNPSAIHALDCSMSPPKPASTVVHTQQYFLRDMCCVQNGEKHLLVTSSYTNRLEAFNTETDELEWSVSGNVTETDKEIHPNGVTADGKGHLFVCDNNNKCIQMFSADGLLMKTLLRQGQQGIGEPQCIRWCDDDDSSSLIVSHAKKKFNHLSVALVYQL